MRVFLDTEFSGLSSDPRLLSIGLVAENGAELYIELTDGWSEGNCSAWVPCSLGYCFRHESRNQ
jgi:hypothetical protein